jgi:hypothetical protein
LPRRLIAKSTGRRQQGIFDFGKFFL